MTVACTIELDCPDRFLATQQLRCAACRKPMCDFHASADRSLCSECVVAQVAGKKIRVYRPQKKGKTATGRFHIGTSVRAQLAEKKRGNGRPKLAVGMTCTNGHTITPETLGHLKGGKTCCRECYRARRRRRYHASKQGGGRYDD